MRSLMTATLVFLPITLWGVQERGCGGAVYFRDGSSVQFEYLGYLDNPSDPVIKGTIGSAPVEYGFCELSEVIFVDKRAGYKDSYRGTAIVVSREGERFTLTECVIQPRPGAAGEIGYVYNDPVTSDLRFSHVEVHGISNIVMGVDLGDIRYNPKTKEYFPASYIYDPYTGEKLIWATR